jgi:DNA ligase-1
MADIPDGQQVEMKGSGAKPYILKNVGGVYSCSCPAWRNQSAGLERRTCKHLRKLRGDAAEDARVGGEAEPRPKRQANTVKPSSSEPEAGKDEASAPPLLLAHSWENDVDLTGWWMSEKLDGVRAYWDGKSFWSRQGNAFLAPDWFTERLPKFPLDGELFGGRQRFQRTVSIVRRHDRSDDWKELAFVVFDAPALASPFEERMAAFREALEEAASPYVQWHPHEVCRGTDHLRQELARVEALGGEGLMLRQPGSRYEAGRSATLLKVKSFKDDEARVVGHVAGQGRHKGRLGALEVELRNGTRFSVGTGFSDAERESPPAPGTVITFRYQELSRDGVPRFPSYVGVRIDADFPAAPKARAKRS